MRRLIPAFLLLTLLAPLAGAIGGPPLSEPKRQRPTEAQREQKIVREVRHQLLLLPYYSVFDNLEFKVQGDKVTLLGQVVRPTLKSDSEAVVKSIEDVASVVNNIEVLPLSPDDDRLRLATYRAIYGDPALFRYGHQALLPIHIIIKNGHCTLEGVVDNESDKNLAGIRANTVPGLFSVENHLVVANNKK